MTLALFFFEAEHGQLPPAAAGIDPSQPPVSWRTKVLPYFDQAHLYEHWDLSKSWNEGHNEELSRYVVPGLFCPVHGHARYTEYTSYVAVTGPETCWPDGSNRKVKDITDGQDRTILLMELPGSSIRWSEPRDITLNDAVDLLSLPELPGAHRTRPKFPARTGDAFIHVSLVDGSVRRMPLGLPKETIRAFFTINGAEPHEIPHLGDGLGF